VGTARRGRDSAGRSSLVTGARAEGGGPPYDAIVIGAGVNGLSAAASLGRAGRRTLLLEAGDSPGGLTRSHEFAPGFRSAPLGLAAGWLPPAVARGLGLTPPERVLLEATL